MIVEIKGFKASLLILKNFESVKSFFLIQWSFESVNDSLLPFIFLNALLKMVGPVTTILKTNR